MCLCTATTAADGRPEREPDSERQATGRLMAPAASGARRAAGVRPLIRGRTTKRTTLTLRRHIQDHNYNEVYLRTRQQRATSKYSAATTCSHINSNSKIRTQLSPRPKHVQAWVGHSAHHSKSSRRESSVGGPHLRHIVTTKELEIENGRSTVLQLDYYKYSSLQEKSL